MKKIVRFKKMTVVIPLDDGETVDEVEDRLIDAVEQAGSRFTTYCIETEDEPDE